MPVLPDQVSYDLGLRWSKRLHKAFKQLVPTTESTPSLMLCQAALARMLGHAHWHAFEATRSRPGPRAATWPAPAVSAVDAADGLPESLGAALNALVWRGGSTLFVEQRAASVQAQVRENGEVRALVPLPVDVSAWLAWAQAHTANGDTFLDLTLAERPVRLMLTRLPTVTGEVVVLRIKAGPHATAPDLAALGYPTPLVRRLEQIVQGPGMVVVAGAVGAGTSTTLRALSWALQRHHAGQARMTDLTGGRNALHADVEAWLNAATPPVPQGLIVPLDRLPGSDIDRLLDRTSVDGGPLVLGRLHAASPLGALLRLVDGGVSPDRLAAALPRLTVVHQRLVARVCPCCSRPTRTVRDPGSLTPVLNRLRQAWTDQGRGESWDDLEERLCWRGDGCAHCHGQGVVGRLALVDAWEPAQGTVPLEELAALVRRQDWATLGQRWHAVGQNGPAFLDEGRRAMQAWRLLGQGVIAPDHAVHDGLL